MPDFTPMPAPLAGLPPGAAHRAGRAAVAPGPGLRRRPSSAPRGWRTLLLACFALWLAGCTALPAPTVPLAKPDALGGYRFGHAARAPDNSSSLFVVLTFSGGGTRAAALAYGVLEELSRVEVQWEGRRRRLLDEVDLVSAVSGGSVTAAYLALKGERIFEDFESRFLHRDVEGELILKLFDPRDWSRMLLPSFGRSDLVAEHLDQLLFEGATYGALLSRPGPFVIVSATDMAAGTRFEFIQDQFDLMCTDLARFPLSRAVAASAAVPVVLSPIVVQSHADRCPPPDLSSFERARREGRLSSRQMHQVDKLQSYLDATERRYIHLLDGGLSDNLGLRSPLEAVFLRDGAWSLAQRIGIADVRKVVFVVVHASTGSELSWNRTAELPGLVEMLRAVKDIPIDRYSFETKELLAASFERWADDVKRQRKLAGDAAGEDLEFVMVDVDFGALSDRAERDALMQVPTTWSLDADTVARIRRAAGTLLGESRAFQELLRSLDATRREPASVPAAH
jgi:NTE family protein